MFNGKIHYKWPFSIAMLVYQRVTCYNLFVDGITNGYRRRIAGRKTAHHDQLFGGMILQVSWVLWGTAQQVGVSAEWGNTLW